MKTLLYRGQKYVAEAPTHRVIHIKALPKILPNGRTLLREYAIEQIMRILKPYGTTKEQVEAAVDYAMDVTKVAPKKPLALVPLAEAGEVVHDLQSTLQARMNLLTVTR